MDQLDQDGYLICTCTHPHGYYINCKCEFRQGYCLACFFPFKVGPQITLCDEHAREIQEMKDHWLELYELERERIAGELGSETDSGPEEGGFRLAVDGHGGLHAPAEADKRDGIFQFEAEELEEYVQLRRDGVDHEVSLFIYGFSNYLLTRRKEAYTTVIPQTLMGVVNRMVRILPHYFHPT
jgi:hypothetical protein